MSYSDRPGRRLKITLVLRDEKDDPSILNIVQKAIEDGLHSPPIGSTTIPSAEPSEQSQERTTETKLDELATRIRIEIEEALAKVIEEFQAAGKEPSFDSAQWAAQLSKVWAVIRKAKAAGLDLQIIPSDFTPPAFGT